MSDNNLGVTSSRNTHHIFPASLTVLKMPQNNFNAILLNEHFANSSQLAYLDLSNNPNLTISFDHPLTNAVEIFLRSCNLGPTFPSWLVAPKNTIRLDISNSNIYDIMPSIFWSNLSPSLSYLNISFNNLHGRLPNTPFQFSRNSFGGIIDLSFNAFSGPIPLFLFTANYMHLSNNFFSSFHTLPHFGNFSFPVPTIIRSTSTDSSTNYIPTNIMDISDNRLSGEIPHWLWPTVFKFDSVNLANNNLSGIVPSLVGYMSNLYVLSLRNNSFSGPLPTLLKIFTSMRILDLSGNKFSGLLPSWLGESLPSLTFLSLQSNSFKGTLPSNLCNLSSLQILDLSQNMLSGEIPSCVHKLVAMTHDVNLSSQILIPMTKGGDLQPATIEEADFYRAFVKWKGLDRLFQKNLQLVKLFDLSKNYFSGEIPTELMSLVELLSLDLSSTNFHGHIPDQIGQLKYLEYLNISYNKLSGPIPLSLSQVYSLGMLDLSYNNLSGRIPKGTQLQGFNSSYFAGNPILCDLPLLVKCPGDAYDPGKTIQPSTAYEGDKWTDKQCFYGGLGSGFAFGFLVILVTLTWITQWRYAFFRFATSFVEWILLVVALISSKISRKLHFQ